MVVVATSGARLAYNGDFDWPGIAIANRLVDLVGVRPWRMGVENYLAGVAGLARSAGGGLVLAGREVESVWDAELGAAMRTHALAVHEETLLGALLAALPGKIATLR